MRHGAVVGLALLVVVAAGAEVGRAGSGAAGASQWQRPAPSVARVDAEASALASRVVFGSGGTAALHSAVRSSGLGWALPSDLAAPYLALTRRGLTIPLVSLARALSGAMPGLQGGWLADELIAQVRTDRTATSPTRRFWSRFIIDLGPRTRTGGDILGRVAPASVRLDPAQALLIVGRFVGDLQQVASRLGPTAAVRSELASRTRSAGPCSQLTETQSQVLEAAQTVQGAGFDKLQEYLEEEAAKEGLQKSAAAQAMGAAGTAVSLADLIASLAFFTTKADFELTPPPPLQRTHTTQPGDQATVKVTLRVESKLGDQSNCLRALYTSFGPIGAKLPQAGPIEGAQVNWSIPASSSDIIRLRSPEGGKSSTLSTTEADGTAETGIEGVPQAADLPDNLPQVDRQAQVDIAVALKPSSLAGDLISAAGIVAGHNASSVVDFITSLLDATASRGASFHFVVHDWAHDYFLDYRSPQGVTLTGGVCDGPAGRWTLDVGGDVSGTSVTGKLEFTMDKYLRATDLTGYEDIALQNASAHVEVHGGRVILTSSGRSATLDFSNIAVTLNGQTPAGGFGGTMFGGKSFTVHVGNFCSSGQSTP